MTDDLEPLLAPRPSAPDPAARDALFRRTARRVAVVRWTRRARTVAVAAGLFVAGWALKPTPPAGPAPEPVVVTVVVPVSVPESSGGPVVAAPTAADAELAAELADDPAEAARLYRLAGDRYLNDRSDFGNAARCYRLHLKRAGAGGLALFPDDSWLLVSVKNDAFKETADAIRNES